MHDPTEAVGDEFDWRALEVRGARVWLAGSPGTKVLHSPDGGRTWEAFATGQNLPMRWDRTSIQAAAKHTLTLEPR